jgi:tRNA(Ile)-lysidine synthase
LPVRRAQVIEYLQSEGQGYRVDASNFDTHHLRNRLRRDIMPTLDLVQPRLVPVLARTARLLQRDSDFVFEQAGAALLAMDVRSTDGCVEASLGVWRSLHPALRRAALILMIDRLLGPSAGITAEQIDDLADGLERSRERLRTPLPHGVSLALRAGRFALTSMPAPDPPPLPDLILPVPGAVETEVGVLRAEIVEPAAAEHEHWMAVCGPLHALCDAEAVRGDLRLGGRRRGERIQPLGFSGSRKLQDLYVDRKIPRAERDRVPVIRDAVGIVWIPGIALDRRVALRPQTARVLHLRWRPGTGV